MRKLFNQTLVRLFALLAFCVSPVVVLSQVNTDFFKNATGDILLSHTHSLDPLSEESIHLSSNGTDGFVVVWMDEREFYQGIWAQRLDQNGQAVGRNFRVSSDQTTLAKGRPECAMDVNGNIMVVWSHGSFTYGKVYDKNLTVLKTDFRISTINLTGESKTITSVPGGGFLVAYSYDSGHELYLQRFTATGEYSGDRIQVYDGTIYDFQNLKLLYDGDVLFFSWIGADSNPIGLHMMALHSDLTVMHQPRIIRQVDGLQPEYDLSVNRQGDVDVFVYEQHGFRYEFRRMTYKKDGTATDAFLVVDPDDPKVFLTPQVLKSLGTNTWLTGLHGDPLQGQLYLLSAGEDNMPSNVEVLGDEMGSTRLNYQKRYVAVSKNTTGNQLIVFRDNRVIYNEPREFLDTDIYAQLLTANCQPVGNNFKVTANSYSGPDIQAAVSINSANEKMIVWQYGQASNSDIVLQYVDENNQLVGINQKTAIDSDSVAQFDPAVAHGFGAYDLVVWAGSNTWDQEWWTQYDHILGQLYSHSSGAKFGSNIIIRPPDRDYYCFNPVVAARPGGGFIVVWEEMTDAWKTEIRGQLVGDNGNLTGEMMAISQEMLPNNCFNPSVGFDASGYMIIAYRVERKKVVYRRYDTAMQPIGDLETAIEMPDYDVITNFKLSMANTGIFYIVTEGTGGIFLSKFLSDGERQGDPELVDNKVSYSSFIDPAPGVSIQVSPDGNRAIVAWSSDKYSARYPKLLARAYQGLVPISDVEIINEQGTRTNAQAYFWNKGLDCNQEQIVFVWSENNPDHNLDVYCKVTDWNLTKVEEYQWSTEGFELWPNPAAERILIHGIGQGYAVFDLKGKLIRTLLDNSWDLSDQSGQRVLPGIYLIRNGQGLTKRLVIQ